MPSNLQRARAAYQEAMQLPMDDMVAVDFILAIIVAQRFGVQVDLPWSYLVGGSGCGKTEMIRPLLSLPFIHKLDSLTNKTFISGYVEDGKDHSLLPLLDDKTLLFPEFTSIMSLPGPILKQIMGDMRGIYDGMGTTKHCGTGPKTFNSKFGVLACVTPEVDYFLSEFPALGERFIRLRIARGKPCHRQTYKNRLKRSRDKAHWRARLKGIIEEILTCYAEPNRNHRWRQLTDKESGFVVDLSMLVTYGRSLPRNKHVITAEGPSRFMQQLANLVEARKLLDDRTDEAWNEADYKFARRVSLDTLPWISMRMLRFFYRLKAGRRVSVSDLSHKLGSDPNYMASLLRQFTASGLLVPTSSGGLRNWKMSPQTRDNIETTDIFSVGAKTHG